MGLCVCAWLNLLLWMFFIYPNTKWFYDTRGCLWSCRGHINDETVSKGKKTFDILVVCYANSTVVYFPLDQDILQLRSISARAHEQYCSINWIPGHSIIITDRKSVSTTQPRSRVKQHLAGVGVEQMALCLRHMLWYEASAVSWEALTTSGVLS